MNPHAMTLDETRDALAEMDGYKREPAFRDDVTGVVLPERWYKNGRWHPDGHPHPPTLDGADAAVPEGWTWCRLNVWWAVNKELSLFEPVPDTGNKVHDLYALALACRRAMEQKESPNA